MQTSLQKLQELLQQLFRADSADLDFGIYRIINYRRDQIQNFIHDELPTIVNDALDANSEADSARQVIESLARQISQTLGDNVLDADGNLINDAYRETRVVQQYLETQKRHGSPQLRDQREDTVYNHLYTFFSRYYESGDFIPRRRYSQTERYAIPYNGEEVYLHWANRDQYYVKSSEYFSTYCFKSLGITVTFELRNIDIERDNVQGAKRFFIPLSDAITYTEETDEICIPFEYRPLSDEEKTRYGRQKQQERINETTEPQILQHVSRYDRAHTALERRIEQKTVLKKHLDIYTRRNTGDFFIHKDLHEFLNRELDIYIKNEVVPLSDFILRNEKSGWLETAKAVYDIAAQIIGFLSQIEEFQKRLWLKKKFVFSTDYCLTLDRVPEKFYSEIVRNTAQREEWERLFAIHEIDGDLVGSAYSEPLSVDFLKENPNLVLDTCHFDMAFKDSLLSHFEDLDDEIDGLLIHGENFQSLTLLAEKYRESINCIHIDPPYNTNTSGFLYKNTYRSSSWLTMMTDRLSLAEQLMAPDSCILSHIDENEYENLFHIFITLPLENQGTIIWDKRNPVFGTNTIATQHEYVVCHSKGNIKLNARPLYRKSILRRAASLVKKHGGVTSECRKEFSEWIRYKPELSGGERAYSKIDENSRVFSEVSLEAPALLADPKFHEPLIHPDTCLPCPVPQNGWSRTPENMQKYLEADRIVFGPDETKTPRLKIFLKDYLVGELSTVIASGSRGKTQMDAMGLNFPYCHPVGLYEELVWSGTPERKGFTLDFFAGSDTNAHAVINLNRQDDGKRKYILIEMAEYFDTVLKPRIMKAVYAEKWRDAKPVSRESRLSHIIKYQRIESYEDALNNITFAERENSLFDEHLLSYWLRSETRHSPTFLNVAKLQNPFSYQLNIVNGLEMQKQTVDLPETFNYLLGVSVQTRRCLYDNERRYLIYRGTVREKMVVIIWRETKGWEERDWERDYNFIQEQELTEGAAEIYVNTNSIVPKAKSLDPLFKKLMFSE